MDGKSLDSSSEWVKIEKNDAKSDYFNPDFDEGFLISICSKSICQIFPTLTINKKGKQYVFTKSYSILERKRFLDIIPKKQISFRYLPGGPMDEDTLPKQHKLLKEFVDIGNSLRSRRDINFYESILNENIDIEKENFSNNEKFYDLRQAKKTIRKNIDELNRIMGDREYFSYSLNFRGLLLFLILYGSARKSKSHDLLFDNVFSNPSIVNIAPFLKYLKQFEELGFKWKELVLTIAEELRTQLHLDTSDGVFLLERATERYYKEFQKYILFLNLSPSHLSLIKNYEKSIISLLKHSIKSKQTVFSFSLKELD
jgi:hypothetical protein